MNGEMKKVGSGTSGLVCKAVVVYYITIHTPILLGSSKRILLFIIYFYLFM